MRYEVVMPQLGLTMEEGTVVSWKKQPGDRVEKGEVLFTVETDKAQMDVESLDTGYVNSIMVNEGTKVPVGTVIAVLSERVEEVSLVSPLGASAAGATSKVEIPRGVNPPSVAAGSADASSGLANELAAQDLSPEAFVASPRARRLAQELGIAISDVRPARGKRVVEEDVRRFHESTKRKVMHTADERAPQKASLSAARMITAQRTTDSFRSAPHFYLGVEANATELVKLREHLLASSSPQGGASVTYTDLFLLTMAVALKEHPQVNAYWQEHGVRLRDSVDIGFAVNTADGLVVPVIRRADQLTLRELAAQRQILTEKARAGTLSLTEMEGGGATLSNLGGFGVDWFQAILNPPQSVILATGRIAKRAVAVKDSVQACPTLILSLSVDHRVLDGVAGASFLGRIKELIENPSVMLR